MRKPFGKTSQGQAFLYEISGGKGMKAQITDFGATLVSLIVPDKDGKDTDVLIGYDTAEEYEANTCYFGAAVGRNANRIADAKVTIDGVDYPLEANDNENNLHSGSNGTGDKMWTVKAQSSNSITLAIVSPDLEQGFPGNASMEVTYTITDDNGIRIDYQGVSDKKTVFNMTNHSYFNLNGYASGTILGTEVKINASGYTPVQSSHSIPTGEIAPVAGTPFDFTSPKTIGQDIEADHVQLQYGTGYDHNYALDKTAKRAFETAAVCYAKESGIVMEVLTDLPGMQLYTGNFIEGQIGKKGTRHHKREGFCMETQYFPDAVHQPAFDSPIVAAGEVYRTTTEYRFSVK